MLLLSDYSKYGLTAIPNPENRFQSCLAIITACARYWKYIRIPSKTFLVLIHSLLKAYAYAAYIIQPCS